MDTICKTNLTLWWGRCFCPGTAGTLEKHCHSTTCHGVHVRCCSTAQSPRYLWNRNGAFLTCGKLLFWEWWSASMSLINKNLKLKKGAVNVWAWELTQAKGLPAQPADRTSGRAEGQDEELPTSLQEPAPGYCNVRMRWKPRWEFQPTEKWDNNTTELCLGYRFAPQGMKKDQEQSQGRRQCRRSGGFNEGEQCGTCVNDFFSY